MNHRFLVPALFLCFLIAVINPCFLWATDETTLNPDLIPVENTFFKLGFRAVGGTLDQVILKAPKFGDDILHLDRKEKSGQFSLQFFLNDNGRIVELDDRNQVYEAEVNDGPDGIKEIHFSTILSEKTNLSTGETGLAIAIRRSYIIHPDSHRIEFKLKLRNEGDGPLKLGTGEKSSFALGGISMLGNTTIEDLGVLRVEKEYDSITLGTKDVNEKKTGVIDYAGVSDTFFVALLEFPGQKPVSVQYETYVDPAMDAKIEGVAARMTASFAALELDGREARSFDFKIFVSRKSYKLLESYNLAELCDMSFLSVFIMNILFFFFNMTRDWGWSIILLTIAIRILLHPLTVKQTRSMKAMQKIQPLVNDLKIRYKDNSQKMNEEVMRLYREHQINPLGGCLPLLIQIPILIALFTSLRNSIELRGEHFFWLPDLSGADPLLILPVLITVSMHFQQKQMNVDPNQAAAMKFMPVFMFFICLSLPAGVLLYWLVSNVLQIFQQAYDPTKASEQTAPVPVPVIDESGETDRKKRKKR